MDDKGACTPSLGGFFTAPEMEDAGYYTRCHLSNPYIKHGNMVMSSTFVNKRHYSFKTVWLVNLHPPTQPPPQEISRHYYFRKTNIFS